MIKINEAIKQIKPEKLIDRYKNKYTNSDFDKNDLKNLISIGKKVSNKICSFEGQVGLVLGQIQSGKTATYLSVICSLFDKGGNFVFLVPAIDNTLFLQTKQRIEEIFTTSRVCIFNTYELLNSTKKLNEAFINEKKVIILCLKNHTWLKKSKELFSNILWKNVNNPLIIDDEGDQASFDNIDKKDPSPVYNGIKELFNYQKKISFLSVTASPMPHFLISKENYYLKPDYAFYSKPGINYFGIKRFVKNSKEYTVRLSNSVNNFIENPKSIMDDDLKDAFLSFFVASAIKQLKDGSLDTTSMFLHMERKISSHLQMYIVIDNYIKNILIRKLKKRDLKTENKIKNLLKSFSFTEYSSNQMIPLIIAHLEFTEIKLINGKTNTKYENSELLHNPSKKNYIYIGSAMLQRGVTIKNLIHSVFTYRAKGTANADTVLQMARWFGYRKNNNLIRVFITEKSEGDFIALEKTVEDMTEKIEYAEKNNISFSEIEKILLIPYADMRATRESVAKNNRSKLSRYLVNQSNQSEIFAEKVFDEIKKSETQTILNNQPFRGLIFENSFEFQEWLTPELLKNIYMKIIPDKIDRETLQNFINEKNPKFILVNMYTKLNQYRLREVIDKKISVTQGRGDTSKGYVGDRYWFKDKNEGHKFKNAVIFQVFEFKLKNPNSENNEKFIYKIAIVLPENIYSYYIKSVEKL